MVTIDILHDKNPGSWSLFPRFRDRVKAFCEKYDSDMNFPIIDRFMAFNFIAEKPTALMLCAVEDGKIVGHCLSIQETWFGNPVVTIIQLEVDRGTRIDKEAWNQGVVALNTFSQYHRATSLQLAARNRAAARLFTRYGFVEKRILMRKSVEGQESKTPESI